MPAIGRDTRVTRLDRLTDDQIQARWSALYPKFRAGFIIALAITCGLFGFNHIMRPGQKVVDIVNAGFQIGAIFTACFLFLLLASMYFKSGTWRTDRKANSS